jgi:hypothetical protein
MKISNYKSRTDRVTEHLDKAMKHQRSALLFATQGNLPLAEARKRMAKKYVMKAWYWRLRHSSCPFLTKGDIQILAASEPLPDFKEGASTET